MVDLLITANRWKAMVSGLVASSLWLGRPSIRASLPVSTVSLMELPGSVFNKRVFWRRFQSLDFIRIFLKKRLDKLPWIFSCVLVVCRRTAKHIQQWLEFIAARCDMETNPCGDTGLTTDNDKQYKLNTSK
jgi:hypothetical protein